MCIYNDIVVVPGIRWLCVRLGLCVGDPYSNLDSDVRRQLDEEDEEQQQREGPAAAASSSNVLVDAGGDGAYRPE